MTEMKRRDPVYVDLGDGQPHELRATLRSNKLLRMLFLSLPEGATAEERERLFTENMEQIVCSMLVGADRETITPEMIGDMPGDLVNQLSESLAVALTGLTLEQIDKGKQVPTGDDH